MILMDTTLLIDLQRGARNLSRRAAEQWLEDHPNEELGLPAIVLGEFSEGFAHSDHPILIAYRSGYQIFSIDEVVASVYGSVSRTLRARGEAIGANDTWIAATALSHSCPILTRNVRHFGRIPDLDVVTYR
jgi:tRNA(fMet)-specific endonuclease VapC